MNLNHHLFVYIFNKTSHQLTMNMFICIIDDVSYSNGNHQGTGNWTGKWVLKNTMFSSFKRYSEERWWAPRIFDFKKWIRYLLENLFFKIFAMFSYFWANHSLEICSKNQQNDCLVNDYLAEALIIIIEKLCLLWLIADEWSCFCLKSDKNREFDASSA